MQHLIDLIYQIPSTPESWVDLLEQFAEEIDRAERNPNKTEPSLENELHQHLVRAIQLGLHINDLEAQLNIQWQSLDLIQTPTLLLDETGKILESNNIGISALNNTTVLNINNNQLMFSSTQQQTQFDSLLEQTKQQPGLHTISLVNESENPFTIGAVTLTQGGQTLHLILLTGSELITVTSSAIIAETLQLTGKEAEITQHISTGKTLKQITTITNISYETARTHLKHVFSKTGCKTQAELAFKVYSCCLPDLALKNQQPAIGHTIDETITLDDGRLLSYCVYGPDNGFPLIAHHTIEGSRKQTHENLLALYDFNIRLIIADRPGYGQSTYYENRQLHDWPKDLAQLIEHLNIDKFSLMGMQYGAEYALVSTQYFQDKILSTHLFSMSTPPEITGKHESPFSFTRTAMFLANSTPKLLQKIVQFASGRYKNRPKDFMQHVMMFQCDKDNQQLNNTQFVDNAFSAWLEGYQQTESMMAIKELQILSKPWDIDFSKIHSPVHIWHSRHDPQASFEPVEALLPHFNNVTTHISEDDCVLTYYHHWEALLNSIQMADNAMNR